MKDYGIAKKRSYSIEKIPFSKLSCADCGGWKPLIAVGYSEEETYMCETCFKDQGYK